MHTSNGNGRIIENAINIKCSSSSVNIRANNLEMFLPYRVYSTSFCNKIPMYLQCSSFNFFSCTKIKSKEGMKLCGVQRTREMREEKGMKKGKKRNFCLIKQFNE